MSTRAASHARASASRGRVETRARRRGASRARARGGERARAGNDAGNDADEAAFLARGAAILRSIPLGSSFASVVDRASELSERDAAALVEAFCASPRLDFDFCEDAFDCAYAAYARGASEEELRTMVSLARMFMSRFRERAVSREWRAVDEALRAARRAVVGETTDADAAREIRAVVDRATANGACAESAIIDALRQCRVKLQRDDKLGASYALEFLGADERSVAELVDPLDELHASARTRRELIDACDVIFRALDRAPDVRAR